MGTINMLFLVLFVASVNSQEESPTKDDREMVKCVKMTKKFMMTRICVLQHLATECLSIATPYVTEVMDYCYKDLNLDPINLSITLQYICSNERMIERVSECLCRAIELMDDSKVEEDIEDQLTEKSNIPETLEYQLTENEEYEYDLRGSYKTSMMHCMQYLNDIYSKRKFHFKR